MDDPNTQNVKGKVNELKGDVKRAMGNAKDDPDMQAEGQAQETKGDLKAAGEKVKDAFKK